MRQRKGANPEGLWELWFLLGATCSRRMGTVTGGEFDWGGNVEVKKFSGVVSGGSNYDSLAVAKCLIIN